LRQRNIKIYYSYLSRHPDTWTT